ncbi:MAG: hypothetical protein E6I27_14055 [Chloroflexi bacterium]|nr:MAG: hypothetical protein E6I27_14055 [Chloroflexota bacterium]
MQLTGPWTSDEVSASGQVFEFRLWAALTEQSRGALHVFLPLSDRGIDALVHRLTDEKYISVQAKGRSTLDRGEIHLVVWADSLKDNKALLVSGLITEGGLGPTILVLPEGDFKGLAEPSDHDGRPIFAAWYVMHPTERSRFNDFLVPTDRLAERFGIGPTEAVPPQVEPRPMWRSDLGSLGEIEIARRLAESGDLNLFRPFPDLETSELAVLHLATRRVLGIQIKTIGVDLAHPVGTVTIHASSFRPSPLTYLAALAWLREEKRFHDECLLIPTEELRGLCRPHESGNHMSFDWHPLSRRFTCVR